MALRADPGSQARRLAQWRSVQGLGTAHRFGARAALAGSDDGDRQMIKVLAAVLTDGLPAVEVACAEALAEGLHSADIILNILARRRDPGASPVLLTPEALRLQHAPVADCARYDQLRSP